MRLTRVALNRGKDIATTLRTGASGYSAGGLGKQNKQSYGDKIDGLLPTLTTDVATNVEAIEQELRGEMASSLGSAEGKIKLALHSARHFAAEVEAVLAEEKGGGGVDAGLLRGAVENHNKMIKAATTARHELLVQRQACGFKMSNIGMEGNYPIPPRRSLKTGQPVKPALTDEVILKRRKQMTMFLRYGIRPEKEDAEGPVDVKGKEEKEVWLDVHRPRGCERCHRGRVLLDGRVVQCSHCKEEAKKTNDKSTFCVGTARGPGLG